MSTASGANDVKSTVVMAEIIVYSPQLLSFPTDLITWTAVIAMA
jgi:hypothetical protein